MPQQQSGVPAGRKPRPGCATALCGENGCRVRQWAGVSPRGSTPGTKLPRPGP